jgi:hypothetical protein
LPLPTSEIDPPAGETSLALSANESQAQQQPVVLPSLERLHQLNASGLETFLQLERFGYFQDREHVAGFRPHAFEVPVGFERSQFSHPPETSEHWAVRRLELVSLLLHDTLGVYESDALPNMAELKDSPTRALNDFEASAIPQLLEKQEIVARATTNRIEMVGAIRASKQCTECHDVPRGTLLGAFSYTLVRDPLISAAVDEKAGRPGPLAR